MRHPLCYDRVSYLMRHPLCYDRGRKTGQEQASEKFFSVVRTDRSGIFDKADLRDLVQISGFRYAQIGRRKKRDEREIHILKRGFRETP